MTEAGWTREKAEKLCEAWFDTGARASWCPKMVDEFAAALADSFQQGRVAGLEEAARRADKIGNQSSSSHVRSVVGLIVMDLYEQLAQAAQEGGAGDVK